MLRAPLRVPVPSQLILDYAHHPRAGTNHGDCPRLPAFVRTLVRKAGQDTGTDSGGHAVLRLAVHRGP